MGGRRGSCQQEHRYLRFGETAELSCFHAVFFRFGSVSVQPLFRYYRIATDDRSCPDSIFCLSVCMSVRSTVCQEKQAFVLVHAI